MIQYGSAFRLNPFQISLQIYIYHLFIYGDLQLNTKIQFTELSMYITLRQAQQTAERQSELLLFKF